MGTQPILQTPGCRTCPYKVTAQTSQELNDNFTRTKLSAKAMWATCCVASSSTWPIFFQQMLGTLKSCPFLHSSLQLQSSVSENSVLWESLSHISDTWLQSIHNRIVGHVELSSICQHQQKPHSNPIYLGGDLLPRFEEGPPCPHKDCCLT